MTTTERHEVEPGHTLAHYRIETPIGEGAMGVVYRAHDLGLDRPVALKVLKTDVSADEEFVQRFVREARAAARVAHPNLTHIYYVGEEAGRHFFAMEYVEGRDLETVVRDVGRLPVDRALDVVIQVARGLATAHAAGVIHRDVKPSNILLQEDGGVRVTDFGLAKSLDADVSSTRAGQVIGTPTFMSPEQCLGQEVGPRTDVYSLGQTLWFLLAGRPPYDTRQIGALIRDHLQTPLPPLSEARGDLPSGLDEVVQRLCAKDPGARPPDMQAVIRLLEPFRNRRVEPAPLMARAAAAFVDFFALSGVFQLAGAALDRLTRSNVEDSLVFGLIYAATFAAYHLFCEARWQQTGGKWLLQLHVVADNGAPPPRRVLLPRFLLRYPWVPLSVIGMAQVGQAVQLGLAGVQVLAALLGIAFFLATGGFSLSDKLTRTRVALRLRNRDDGAA